jgi:hypothetical protein
MINLISYTKNEHVECETCLFRAKIPCMSNKKKVTKPQKPLTPAELHRKQMAWQVWVPLWASVAIILALVILTIFGAVTQSSQVERWGNLSAVWVIIPVLLTLIIFLVLIGGCVYGMSKLLKAVPGWMLAVQLFMVRVSQIFRQIADAVVRPVISVHQFSAEAKTLGQKIFSKK